jgi:anthranilate phosphoribosyltransferase
LCKSISLTFKIMSDEFRELLKKIGSGIHTSKDLTRAEAAMATKMMLEESATPAQIGAFLIAHRIKRPTPEELAGILDTYDELGQKLSISNISAAHTPIVFGLPYDGRSRTVPVTLITTLILAAADVPVILHGGDCMPTKYGIPLVTIWQKLGVDFSQFSLSDAQTFLEKTNIGFVYLPKHFPLANNLVPYREQIGKRPTIATAELAWSPVKEKIALISGFVHPPTEERFLTLFKLTVKGLEGSCDLSRNRTAIIGLGDEATGFNRLLLHPGDYNLNGSDLALESLSQTIAELDAVLQGKNSPLMSAVILNGGFYLWRSQVCSTIEAGLTLAEEMIAKGTIRDKLKQLREEGRRQKAEARGQK